MRCFSAVVVRLVAASLVAPALGQEHPKDEGSVKTFTYKGTKQADLEMAVPFSPGWKEADQRPAFGFFSGGGWQNGTIQAFQPQAQYLAGRGMVAPRANYWMKFRHGVTPKKCLEDAQAAHRLPEGAFGGDEGTPTPLGTPASPSGLTWRLAGTGLLPTK
jgi:hypothetical protein